MVRDAGFPMDGIWSFRGAGDGTRMSGGHRVREDRQRDKARLIPFQGSNQVWVSLARKLLDLFIGPWPSWRP